MASDAFFLSPTRSRSSADAGCTAVIHPGGSKGDEAVLAAAEERGMAVVLTGHAPLPSLIGRRRDSVGRSGTW